MLRGRRANRSSECAALGIQRIPNRVRTDLPRTGSAAHLTTRGLAPSRLGISVASSLGRAPLIDPLRARVSNPDFHSGGLAVVPEEGIEPTRRVNGGRF